MCEQLQLLRHVDQVQIQFRIHASRQELEIVRRGPLFRRTFAWRNGELKSVRVDSSGTKINNRALHHVRIQPRTGSYLAIMNGHSKKDLAAVAAAIGKFMALGKK